MATTALFAGPYAITRTPTANEQMLQNINTPLLTLSIDLCYVGIQTSAANVALALSITKLQLFTEAF